MNHHSGKTIKLGKYINRTSCITNLLLICAIIISTLIITPPVSASDLDDFEAAATTDNSQQTSDDQTKKDDNNPLDKFFTDLFGDIFNCMTCLAYEGAKMSYARVGGKTDIDPTTIEIRQTGEPTLPYFQMDYKYMHINSEISALDSCLEFGNGPFGFECRNTYFTEINPSDNLTLTQYHLLLRMSPNRSQEYGIGIGMINLCGNEQNSGFSLTFPIKIYPNPTFGIRFKPTYSWINGNFINDNDLSFALTERFGSLELGYRFLETNGKNLDGSYIGLALHY